MELEETVEDVNGTVRMGVIHELELVGGLVSVPSGF